MALRQLRESVEPSQTPRGARVELENIRMVYQPAGITALEDVTCHVEPGSFCSFLGPSGCGKSTILMLVAGLFGPTSGRVFVDGKPPMESQPHVGFVFQKDALLPWLTVIENVMLPFRIRATRRQFPQPDDELRQRARELLEMAGLGGFENRYPSELSGGMRQRVAICRALVVAPPLLLMDEPFAALDSLTREQMGLELLRLWSRTGATVLFVTHNVDEAVLLSDKIIVFSPRPGRVYREIEIPLPRPRDAKVRNSRVFAECVEEARACFYEMGYLREEA